MNSFKITFEDGNVVFSDMNATFKEAQEYYLGKAFQFGDTEEHPGDRLIKAIKVERIQEFANTELEKAVRLAKEMGLKVWTFKTSSNLIKQVFFDNGKTFGTASECFGGIRYGTCHHACKECGTGFSLGEESESASKERIEQTFALAPSWATREQIKAIRKESFQAHREQWKMMEYFEL